jgi:osmotically-inducible protein OsmY
METVFPEVEKKVSDALANDPRTRNAVVEVVYYLGKLTLRGTVDSLETREAVESIARLYGNVPVLNELRVERQLE